MGASAGLGRALTRILASAGHDLVIASSDSRDLDAGAADLAIRHGIRVEAVAGDLGAEGGADRRHLDRLVAASEALGGVDGLLFPLGTVAPDDDGLLDGSSAAHLVQVNFLSVVGTVARFLPQLQRRPRSVIVGFGSVAAARGRRANVVYAAAKRALESFFESLRHRCAGSSVIVQFYVVGYLDTNLAFGRRTPLPRAKPERLAARVVRDLGKDVGVAYYPPYWRPLATALRHAPWPVLRRMAL
jgi:short-subunit dehydrogenase